jgi:hypothetical protein
MTRQETTRFDFEQTDELLAELNTYDCVTVELSKNIKSELQQVQRFPDDTLLVGTEGSKTVTIFLAPHHVVDGVGPVLIPTFDDHRVVSMVSREFIEARAGECLDTENQDAAQEVWNALLDKLFDDTLELAENLYG